MIPQSSVFWKHIDGSASLEQCALSKDEKNWQIKGTLISIVEGNKPIKAEYSVICDLRWQTREADLSIATSEGSPRSMKIIVDLSQRWWVQGREHGELRGCFDLDIGLSPSTNTLPIRRLNLPIGNAAEISVAWLDLPTFKIQLASQKYSRTGEQAYRYENIKTGLSADLDVDELGLVTSYGNVWARC